MDLSYSGQIQIIGINTSASAHSDTSAICSGRDLPFLQDTFTENVWGIWNALQWDIFILDRNGNLLQIYDVGDYNLTDQSHYDELKTILKQAADN